MKIILSIVIAAIVITNVLLLIITDQSHEQIVLELQTLHTGLYGF